MLVETYKITSKDHISKHDSIIDEWLKYVVDNAKRKGWKTPIHKTYSIQGEDLGRMFMVLFDSREHQNEWMTNVRDDKFQEYNDKFMEQVEDFTGKFVKETWSI
jgi:hypothetical protein